MQAYKGDVTIPVYGTIADADVYLKKKVNAVLAEKDAAIAELKAKLESVQASMDADLVDAGMENRRLKCALWLAREWRAWCEGQFWFIVDSDKPKDVFHLLCTQQIVIQTYTA